MICGQFAECECSIALSTVSYDSLISQTIIYCSVTMLPGVLTTD